MLSESRELHEGVTIAMHDVYEACTAACCFAVESNKHTIQSRHMLRLKRYCMPVVNFLAVSERTITVGPLPETF